MSSTRRSPSTSSRARWPSAANGSTISAPPAAIRCFVAAREGRAIGWTCSAWFKDRAAYDTSIETSIYLAPGEGGKGLGRRLYETLFDALKGEDIHRAYGGITLPNEASVGVHKALGFEHIGTYPEIGREIRPLLGRGALPEALPLATPQNPCYTARLPAVRAKSPGFRQGPARAWRNW